MKAYAKAIIVVALISNSLGMARYARANESQPEAAGNTMTAEQAKEGLIELKAQLVDLQAALAKAEKQDDGRLAVKWRNVGLGVAATALLRYLVTLSPRNNYYAPTERPLMLITVGAFIFGVAAAVGGEISVILSPEEADAVNIKIDALTSKIHEIENKMAQPR